jgi:hypothetical protein
LAANPRQCSLAVWHHPLFSSGQHGNETEVRPFWDLLYAAGAEMVINGHDHDYERFAPQAPDGTADPTQGIRELVVGTGGAGLRGFTTIQPNSEVRNNTTNGVIELSLSDFGYSADFRPASGQQFTDSFTGTCHDAPAAPPPPQPGSSLLVNGGFELANLSQQPDGWTRDPRFTRDSGAVHAGEFAARHSASDDSAYKIIQDVTVTAGASYAASGFVNVPTTSDPFRLVVKVQWRSQKAISTVITAKYTKPTAGWVGWSGTLTAPVGTTTGRIMMVVSSLNATLYVDSFEFTAAGAQSPGV